MAKLASLMILLVLSRQTMLQHDQDASIDMNAFKEAVVQAYNSSKSFSHNFYELLGLICPESVYCQTNGTFDTENADFRDLVEDETSVPEDFLQNYDHAAISDARIFLQMNAHHLAGCCSRCSCAGYCREQHTCCPSMDVLAINSEDSESTSTNLATQKCVYANIKAYLENFMLRVSDMVGSSYFMVSDCATANVSDAIATKCTNPSLGQVDETIPVYSTDVDRIYKNIFCARCNDAAPVTAMTPLITINHMVSLTENLRLPSSPRELYTMASSDRRVFDIWYNFPRETLNEQKFVCWYPPFSRLSELSQCDRHSSADTDQNQVYLFKRACEGKQHLYRTDMNVYTNVFCYLCRHLYSNRKSTCGVVGSPSRDPEGSFSVLLSGADRLSDQAQLEATSAENALCSCAEIFDTSKKVCREILCPPGEMRIVCACAPFITNITGLRIKLHLELRPQLTYSVAKTRFGGDLQTSLPATITKAVRKLVAAQFGPLISDGQYLFRSSTTTGDGGILTLHYCEILTLEGGSDDREELKSMFTTLHAGLTMKIVATQMKISLGRIFHFSTSSNIIITDPNIGTELALELLYPGLVDYVRDVTFLCESQPLNKLVYCQRVKLDEDEAERLYNVTAGLGWPQAYLEYVYWEQDGSMCLDDFKAAFMPDINAGAYSYNYMCLTKEYQILMIGTIAFHSIMLTLK